MSNTIAHLCIQLGFQVLWCTLGYMNCLTVTCSEGLIIYDCDQKFKRIYTHNCEDKNMKEKYAKGITTFECTYLCVGMLLLVYRSILKIQMFFIPEQGTIMDR